MLSGIVFSLDIVSKIQLYAFDIATFKKYRMQIN